MYWMLLIEKLKKNKRSILLSSEAKDIAAKHMNLPPMQIPTFSGKHSDWETFRDLFLTVVDKAFRATDTHNFTFLKSNVQAKALEIVSKYKLIDANYKLAWSVLEAYYENKRRLINTHLTVPFNVKPIKAETSEAPAKLLKEIYTPFESLKALGSTVDQWSDIIVFLKKNRFDENTLRDWQRFLGNSVEPAARDKLRKFAEYQIIYLETLESSVKSPHK